MANTNLVVDLRQINILQGEQLVLEGVNLRISKGEFVYLIGKTGSGKSSLLKTLYGALPLREGQAKVTDIALTSLDRHSIPTLRRNLGIVFQDFNLLTDRSVKENLDFVLRATGWEQTQERNNRIQLMLEQVGLNGLEHKMPHQLSGGEQQRIAIARALLNNPELILADEPTGNLDPQTSVEVMEVLRKINSTGKTILMATHDYALLLKFPAKTLKFEGGKVFEVVQRTV